VNDPFTIAGTTSIFNSTSPVEIGDVTAITTFDPAQGRIYGAEVRNGIGGTVVANPNFSTPAAGVTSFADPAGRTWTVNAPGAINDRDYRFTGEISSWPPKWDVSGRDVWTPVEASGIQRRLGQGAKALQSTLRRRIPSEPRLRAYWPMEEGQAATQAYSAVSGKPLRISGFQFGSADSLPGSAALPTLTDNASLAGTVTGAAPGGWQAEMVYRLDTMPATEQTMMNVNVAGASADLQTVRVRISTAGIRIQGLDSGGTQVAGFLYTTPADVALFTGTWNRLLIYTYTSGGTVNLIAAWRDIVADSYRFAAASFTGSTPGRIVGFSNTWGADFQGMAFGHLSAFDLGGTALLSSGVTIYSGADDGFDGETAGDRMVRLAREEGVPVYLTGGRRSQELVGPQRPDILLTLLGDAADVDGGILYEPRDRVALRYRDRASLYNQAVGLTLGYTTPGHVAPDLQPVDDDQSPGNDVTVSRVSGSSARVVDDTSPLGTQAPPAGIGVYEQSVTVNVSTDDQLLDIAGWLLHLNTWDAVRMPVVSVDLAAAPSLTAAVTALNLGDRIQITNPPVWVGPDTVDLIVQGYTETIGLYDWDFSFNCTPGGPWNVAVTDDLVLGRADTDNSQLNTSATSTATSLSVAVTAGTLWPTAPAEMPFDIRVGGEVMRVTAVSGATSPQTFTVTRSINGIGKAQTAGTVVRLAQAAYVAR
jgi:hypothetical protein